MIFYQKLWLKHCNKYCCKQMNYSNWNQLRFICMWHQMLSCDYLLQQVLYHCQSKTAHIKTSETSPSWHFLEEKRSVYTFVCVSVTRLLFEHPSPAVMTGFDVLGVTSPLHLPCHNPISLSCLHSLRFPLTREMCPSWHIPILSPPFRFITPLMCFPSH